MWKNLILQALQYQKVGVSREFAGQASIINYRPNESFMEG
jgi:hypothetical protein